jgi:hypothetical protein
LKAQQTTTQNTRPKPSRNNNKNVIAFAPLFCCFSSTFFFLNNSGVNNNKTTMASDEGNPAVYLADWRTSKAKKVLKQMIQDRRVTEAHAPLAVYKIFIIDS